MTSVLPGERTPGPMGDARGSKPIILVVDDSADMRGLLEDVLDSAGYGVVTAASGAAALRAMSETRPDVVITDLLMPGMSGFSLRAAMLRRPELAQIPVIVLSAYWRRPGETLEAIEALPKPLNIERLLDSVARLVGDADATAD